MEFIQIIQIFQTFYFEFFFIMRALENPENLLIYLHTYILAEPKPKTQVKNLYYANALFKLIIFSSLCFSC